MATERHHKNTTTYNQQIQQQIHPPEQSWKWQWHLAVPFSSVFHFHVVFLVVCVIPRPSMSLPFEDGALQGFLPQIWPTGGEERALSFKT